MISRRTTLQIANIICEEFTHQVRETDIRGNFRGYVYRVKGEELRDFLFEFNVDGFVIEKICHSFMRKEELKKDILNIHTGMLYSKLNYSKFINMGQKAIKGMAIGILYRRLQEKHLENLENLLRIDGYIYENEKLYVINTDVDDKTNIIKSKFKQFKFNNEEEFETFYNNMNEHYENSKWEDSIHNSRKLYEIVLKECAMYYSINIAKDGEDLIDARAVDVRRYLEKVEFFSEDEANIIQYYYKYLSNIGSHPKLALKEQAEFSRVMSINTMLYAINRLENYNK